MTHPHLLPSPLPSPRPLPRPLPHTLPSTLTLTLSPHHIVIILYLSAPKRGGYMRDTAGSELDCVAGVLLRTKSVSKETRNWRRSLEEGSRVRSTVTRTGVELRNPAVNNQARTYLKFSIPCRNTPTLQTIQQKLYFVRGCPKPYKAPLRGQRRLISLFVL
jgi:hypothetical protein